MCDCHLAWLGQWLKKTRVVSGNPRCQKPAFLKEIPIQDVATPDFTCDGTQLYTSSTRSLCLVHESVDGPIHQLSFGCVHIDQYTLSCTHHPFTTPAHKFPGVATQTTWQHLMNPGSLNSPQLSHYESSTLCLALHTSSYRVMLV